MVEHRHSTRHRVFWRTKKRKVARTPANVNNNRGVLGCDRRRGPAHALQNRARIAPPRTEAQRGGNVKTQGLVADSHQSLRRSAVRSGIG